MARGFLSGALWGIVLSGSVAGVASIVAPPPLLSEPPEVPVAAPDSADAPAVPASDTPQAVARQDDTPDLPDQPVAQGEAPDPDTLSGLGGETTAPTTAPDPSRVADMDAPDEPQETTQPEIVAENPVLPNPQALAPMAPQPADDAPAGVETEAPRPPVVADSTVAAPDAAPLAPEMPATDDQAGLSGQAGDQSPRVENPAPAPETAALPSPPAAEMAPAEPATPAAPQVTETAEPDADTAVAILTPSSPSRIGTPVVPLTERADAVTVNRPGQDAEDPDPATSPNPDAPARPVVAFAADFENPDDKPLLSVVLIDDGTGPTAGAAGIAALRSFPYPISFAVDSTLNDAAERMALYRVEGFEVLAIVDLPEGAEPRDAETSLSATLTQMDEAVAVLEGMNGGLQGNKDVADQVTAYLARSGHGLVTQDKGLNTMPKLALKEGVPAAPIFRDFDSKGQTATVIRRFLDQAAFKAGQEGAVIMLGRLRPDTITALLLWGLQDRAGQVAIAPVSAVLTRDTNG